MNQDEKSQQDQETGGEIAGFETEEGSEGRESTISALRLGIESQRSQSWRVASGLRYRGGIVRN
jgi:hypothetical protein